MTYSDVITLLMTFFILLLTFATNEPESFQIMQHAVFGGGGATGTAGDSHGPLELTSLMLRERPQAARRTMQGTEMPPAHTDPETGTISKGLAALSGDPEHDPSSNHSIETALDALVDVDGTMTELGTQRLRMMGMQIKVNDLLVSFEVSESTDLDRLVAIGMHLVRHEEVPPGNIRLGLLPENTIAPSDLLISLEK